MDLHLCVLRFRFITNEHYSVSELLPWLQMLSLIHFVLITSTDEAVSLEPSQC